MDKKDNRFLAVRYPTAYTITIRSNAKITYRSKDGAGNARYPTVMRFVIHPTTYHQPIIDTIQRNIKNTARNNSIISHTYYRMARRKFIPYTINGYGSTKRCNRLTTQLCIQVIIIHATHASASNHKSAQKKRKHTIK